MNKAKAKNLRGPDGMELTSRFAGRQLRMADGGMFDGIKRAIGIGPAETVSQKFARQDAEFRAANPAPAASAPAPKAITDYAGNGALERRMKAAGLRDGGDLRTGHGGDVPGKGTGDKIDAKYEPGEFVVSNDMLDAQPELRDHLRGLREAVLAEKGMTPAQADAKAVGGGGLRADLGWTADALQGKRMLPPVTPMQSMAEQLRAPTAAPVAPPAPPKYTPPPVNPATGGYVANERIVQGVQSGAGGGTTPVQGGGVGSEGRVPGAAGAAAPQQVGFRAGLKAQPGPLSKTAFAAGRALSAPATQLLGRAAGGAGVVTNFNDYKINDPDVDSSASGTWGALRNGDFAGAGRSLSKGALETGMDLGSFAANTADLFVPGTGPSTAYNKMLRDNLGDQLTDNSGNGSAPPATKTAAAQPGAPQTYPNANPASTARSLRVGDPSSPDLKDQFSNAMIENRNPGGKVTKVGNSYSGDNVSGEVSFQGADGNALRGRPGGGYLSTDTSAGFASDVRVGNQMEAERMQREAGWRQQDTDVKALNQQQQDSWDTELAGRRARFDASGKKTGGNPTRERGQEMELLASRERNANALRTTSMTNETSRSNNADSNSVVREGNINNNKTSLRGQDMDYERAMAPIKLQAKMRQYSADVFKAAGGDNAKAARMMQEAGLDPKQFLDVQKSELDNSTSQQAQLKAARESGKDRFKGVFVKKGKDGDERDELGEARAESMLNQLTGGQFAQMGEAEQQAAHKQAVDLANMFGQIQTPKLRGLDKLGNQLGMVNDPVGLSAMPNFKGGKAVRRGLGMTYGADAGTWDVTDGDGNVHNFQNLEKSQIELLRKLGVGVN